MAIKITDKLIEEVGNHIIIMRDAALVSEFGSKNSEIPFQPCHEDAEAVDALLWGEHLHFKSKIPQKWCEAFISRPSEAYRCVSLRLAFGGERMKDLMDFRLQLDTLGKTYYAPPDFTSYNDVAIRRGIHPKVDALYDSLAARRDVTLKWGETDKKVTAFLRSSPTLNQAAKVWPEVIHFLPPSRKEQYQKDIAPKVRKKADTSALEAAIAEIDKDALAGDLVAFRFQTA